MKVAIIGGTGLLGSNLVRVYKNFDVKAFSRNNSVNIHNSINNIINFNYLNTQLEDYFNNWNPDIIINTIANINLDYCQLNYDDAFFSNCTIANDIAKIAKKYNCYLIHISTDHYYNDNLLKHNENNKVKLLNNYAKTKYLAEKKVLSIYKNSIIVRTNIIGFRNSNKESFFEWLINSLSNNVKINLYNNFYTSPIAVEELAPILIKCYKSHLTGIYNISSSEVISKYNFGILVSNKFSYSTSNIKSAILKNNNIKRALTLGLDVTKIENDLDILMPTIKNTIDTLFDEYKDKNE